MNAPVFRIREAGSLPTRPTSRLRRAGGLEWLAALGVVGLFSAVWYGLAERPIRVLPRFQDIPPATVPRIAYLSSSAAAGSDVRQVRSPVLMSLPTPLGFSGPVMTDPVRLPVPGIPDPEVVRIAPDPDFTAGAFGETARRLAQTIQEPRPMKIPEPDPAPFVPVPVRAAAQADLFLYWADHPDAPLDGFPVDALPEFDPLTAWQAVFFVCFDAQGWPQSLVAERPAPDAAVQEALTRAMRGRMLAAPVGTPCRRLHIHYRPGTVGGGPPP
ncbi:MAG TPA: hypothetical protein PKE26_14310 [Kiritimatiellia bacterium]|nr:hypothetical protein [Kiritimatiellia bacterium]HMP00274.1 hypothetical protein [Kiritimatiellia bacterium]HMP96991.1 hypothetical protein [Kiritimatiellia bacterium]